MAQLPDLKVTHSKIHGYGVVTLRPFKKGEIVCYGEGVVYRESQEWDDTYSLIMPAYESDEDEDGPPMFLDLVDQTRWINHCCEPNTEIDSSWDPKSEQITAWWIALRDIEVGEELAYDYAFSAEVAEPCACGAAACRGVIVDEDEIDDVPAHLAERVTARYRKTA